MTHPSVCFFRRAIALFLMILLTSRPPELSPSLVDTDGGVHRLLSSVVPAATFDNRLLILTNTLFTLLTLLLMFSFEKLRSSLPKSLPSSVSEELAEPGGTHNDDVATGAMVDDWLTVSSGVTSDCDCFKLLTDACWDFFKRNFSSELRSDGNRAPP